MKQIRRPGLVMLKILFVALTNIYFIKANATTQVGLACPQKFIAAVINVQDLEISPISKVEVDFQIIQILKGEQIHSKKIQIVKDGPLQFKNGEVYTVESRDSWLCSATLFTKN